jgi:hypothetical protein
MLKPTLSKKLQLVNTSNMSRQQNIPHFGVLPILLLQYTANTREELGCASSMLDMNNCIHNLHLYFHVAFASKLEYGDPTHMIRT